MDFDINVIQNERNVPEASGEGWSYKELHDALMAHKENVNLDLEWRFHILAVRRIDDTPRGAMFDIGSLDSNNVPREGIAIASDWVIPSGWGSSSGLRFGDAKAAYFRTAVHEIGHAMGLEHNESDNGFMNTSEEIADRGNKPGATLFPGNIKWEYAADDLKRLKHRPDIYIRPGGIPMNNISDITPQPTPDENASLAIEIPELQLELKPLLTEVPLGAPVRVELKLTNNSHAPISVPARIDLKSNVLKGGVTDSSGRQRTFTSLFKCMDEEPLTELKPNASIIKSVTLLRGGEGALFQSSGVSTISVQLRWSLKDESGVPTYAEVSGSNTVFVYGPITESHARYAHKVLTSPDLQLLLVLGSTSSKDAVDCLDSIAKSDVLGPHWGVVKAKLLASKGETTYGEKVLSDERGVMSSDERSKLERLLK